uniref:MYND-type domain-containing protein n=1 Tax=Globodera pallida TaxID=36090 RepID=A0A183CDU2_GLOPA
MDTSGLIGSTPSVHQSQSIDFYPFAYALFDENLGKHCWYCLDDENKHKRCTGCHRALFCDQNCQILAWKDHKFECRGIKANNGNVPDIEVRLLGRIVTRHKAISCGMDKKCPNFYKDRHSRRNIMDIWAHTKSIEKDRYAMSKFEDIFARLSSFYEPKAMLSREIVFELHCRDFINRHAISDKHYLREIGKGLYLDLCAYDHSCRPNTVYSCRSFVATLRPLNVNVKMLDRSSTFYSYIDLLCAKQDRRKLLKDTWYFQCECERCGDDSEHILTSMLCPHCPPNKPTCLRPFGQSDHKDAQSQLLTCPQCDTTLQREEVAEAIAAMRFISEMLEKTDFERMEQPKALSLLEGMMARFQHVLPPINVFFCKIVQALLPHIDQTDIGRLLALHLLVEPCIRQCYPQNHPALAFHLRNIGIFAKELNNVKRAETYLVEAFKMFQFVMGPQHSLTTLTAAILEEMSGRKEKGREEEKDDDKKEGQKRERNEKRMETPEGKEVQKGGGGGAGIVLKIEPPEEDEDERCGRERPEELVASLVQLSISRASGEGEGVVPSEECFQQIDISAATSSSSRPDSVLSGAALSPYHSSSDGGVKKKLKLKKGIRRKRTPLPPKPSADGSEEEEEEKSEASLLEDVLGKEGSKRKSKQDGR